MQKKKHLSLVTEYVDDIFYILVDCLLRPEYSVTTDLCDLLRIITQQNDSEIKLYADRLKSYIVSDKIILSDVPTLFTRPRKGNF